MITLVVVVEEDDIVGGVEDGEDKLLSGDEAVFV